MSRNNGSIFSPGETRISVEHHAGPNAHPSTVTLHTPGEVQVHIFGGCDRLEAMVMAVAQSSASLSPTEVVRRAHDIYAAHLSILQEKSAESAAKQASGGGTIIQE